MGAGQSTPEMASSQASQASVCDFSKEQIVKLGQEIDKINGLILSVKRNGNYNKVVSDAGARIPELEGARFANYMSTLTGRPIEDKIEKINLLNRNPTYFSLILEHLLYDQVKDILEEYKAILSSIKTLCEKYQSNCVADVVVEQDIDVIISENFSKAQTHLNLFNQIQIPDTIASTLKETIGIINEINERFSNIDNIITEMKTICERTRTTTRLFSRAGGKTARSAYKKRKQMKMKMKNSNSRSKTRNNKKKYTTMVKV
jgi:hypothetical protein